MIVSENWPGATPEMLDGYIDLMSAVGAIPSHKEVEFDAPVREIMTYAAMDYSEEAIGQELGITREEMKGQLRPVYDQLHGQHGGNRFQKLAHLTYITLNNRLVPYPNISHLRPDVTTEEGVVLLGLASRQPFYKLIRAIKCSPGSYKLNRTIDGLHEKFGTETNHGLVGRGFMFGFFSPSIKPAVAQ